MGLVKVKSRNIQRIARRVFACAGIGLVIGVLVAIRPAADVKAAIDPGLDSGNAVVDRTSVSGQTILKYQTAGTSTFKAPAGVTNVRVLVVGGGGGGGAGELNAAGDAGGGGGAGEYLHQTSQAVTPGQAVTITVGGGGTGSTTKQNNGGTTAQNGTNGSNSVFGSLTARGGGGAGGNDQHGLSGGSGGGAGGHCTSASTNGGASTAVSPGVGNAGGNSPAGSCTPRGGAGGGGAGAAAAGTNGSSGNGGVGAAGLQNDITGTNTFYSAGGGGGGGLSSGTGANGGSSKGGNGGNAAATGGNGGIGAANSGSGGGGGGATNSSSGGNGGNGGSGIVIVRFATQDIPDAFGIAGVRMWYKADSAGNTNALWNDSSGFGYNLSQGTASKQPVLTTNAINFNPGYVFDGTDDVFSMPSHGILGSEGMTALFGAKLTRSDGGWRYFNEFGDDKPSIGFSNGKPELYVRDTIPISYGYTTDSIATPHVFTYISPNANNQSRIVGVDDNEQSQNVTTGTYTTSSGSQSGNTLGSTNGSSGTSFAGPIAEAIYFNRVLTAAERLKVVSYLAIKYGVTRYQGTSGAGYADSAGTTIWPADATFKNNIAGIGRDDTTTLNQKQSKSSQDGDIVTIGHGAIAASNQANTNNFGIDKVFLLWGHNGAATNTNTAVTGPYVRMSRIWKAVRTTSMGTIKVRVPKSAVTQGSNGVMYISTSTTFDASSQRITMTDLGTEYEATVTSLPAATSYFSFGSLAGADLQFVSKTATDPGGDPITSYTPGEPMDYVLKVKNNGPDPTSGPVTVTDTLPAGLVPTNASGAGWSCPTPSGQIVTCTRSAPLNSGNQASDIIIEATVASSVTGPKANTATASVANDPDNSNNSASLTLPAAPKADLSITKAHSGTPTAGGQYTYNFTVTNNGPSNVASFTVTDTLNANLTYASAAGIACTGTTSLTCTGGAVNDGQTVNFSITVNVSPSYPGGDIPNTGTVAVPAGTTDPNSNNNSSTDNTTVLVSTDLGITKAHSGNFTAGEDNTFTITVDNQGPSNSPANSVTITDTLDEDFTFVSATSAGNFWSCTISQNTVTCNNTGTITAGGSAPAITLTVSVDSIAKGNTTNTAEVSSTTPDPNPNDNSSSNPVTIVSEADLGITKAHVGTAFTAGNQQEQYTLSVVNNGPSADSPSYTITDTLPSSLTFVSATGDASCSPDDVNPQLITCTGGAISAGAPAQVTTITVAVNGSATGTINNSATVAPAAGTTDPVPGNNTDGDTVNVEPNADMTITKTPSTNMTAGAAAQYTLTAHNNGPSNVSSFTVTDTLDSNLTFQPSTGCSVTNTLPDGRQEVTCTGGAVTSGQDATAITLNVLVESTATPGSTISNTATVAPPADVNDPTPGNNSSSVDRSVVASADLEISKSHTGNFTAGTTNTYTMVVTNNGPSDASEFTVTDTLPDGLTFVSGMSTAGINASCTNAGQIVTCTGGPTIGTGQTSTITLTVTADANLAGNTTLDNTASVASATPDPDTSNNTTPTDTVTIDSVADLEVTKSNGSDFTAGNDEDYTIGVVNHGPSDVSGFTVTDTLPAGLTFVSSGSDPACSAIGQDVTCTGSALASGANTSFTIRVHTDSGLGAGTVINNTVDVVTIAPTTDPNSGNNSFTDPTTVVNITDLSIQKGHTGAFVAGQTGQYTFTVSNAGPSATPAGDVEISDTLPEGMTFASGTGTGWSCAGSSGRNVTCDYAPSLAVSGTTPTLTVTVDIAADKQGEVTNYGTVISTLDDSDPPDDTDSDTTTVTAEADLTATKQAQGSLTAGEPVTYRFEVTNNGGPSDANSVTITDDMQGRFTYQNFNSVTGSWSCSEANGTFTCTLPSLAVGASATVDVTLLVAQDAPNPTDNTAAVTFNGTDPSPANPSDSEPVSYLANLGVKLSHESKTYRSGDTVKFTYTVDNYGPSAAKDVVLTDKLPEGLTFESIVASAEPDSPIAAISNYFMPTASAAPNTPFNCSNSGQNITCTASSLAVGTYVIQMIAQINSNFTGNLTSVLAITSSTPDPNPNNNQATDTITDVQPGGGLADTGQNLLVWLIPASMTLAGVLMLYRQKKSISQK